MLVSDNELESSIHIDFVPMADVLFNLVIFFLLATTIAQVEREIDVALPFAASGAPISQSLREIVVTIEQEGRPTMNGRAIELDELRSVIKDAVVQNPEQKVTIRADRRTAYSNVVRVLDACKNAGVQQPYLDTILEN